MTMIIIITVHLYSAKITTKCVLVLKWEESQLGPQSKTQHNPEKLSREKEMETEIEVAR